MRTNRIEVPAEYITDAKERLRRNVVITPAGCWEWKLVRNSQGYGNTTVGSSIRGGAHRISYAVFNGPVPQGMVVMHLCDNPPCINPDHLKLGTHEENVKDCHKKGRHWSKKRLSNWKNVQQKYCRKGLHEMEGHNVIWSKTIQKDKPWVGRQCRTCKRERDTATRKAKLSRVTAA